MDNIYILAADKIGKIKPNIYGVFAEHLGSVIYDGIYCGKDSKAENIRGFRKFIIDKMKEANIPMIRWPGGCFAEMYDWRDGIGLAEDRPTRINWWTHRDGRYEPNIVGTDEFLDFCELCEAQPYMAANITSTTPLNIRDWIDYCNSPAGSTTMAKLREKNGRKEPYNVKLWGVGNETWGGGGNMTPEYYAMEYRRYSEVMANSAKDLELIGSGAYAFDYNWTRKFCENIKDSTKKMSGYSFHYYCGILEEPIEFSDDDWYKLLKESARMQELIDCHWGVIMSYGLEDKAKLCIDEWGIWYKKGSGPSKGANILEQQSTMRDAVLSAQNLNIFNNNCEKIKLTTVAQLVNCLHSLFLSGGEHCITTPTYHIFNMFKTHQNGTALRCVSDTPDACEGLAGVSVSASVKDGKITVTAANQSAEKDVETKINLLGATLLKNAQITTLAHTDLHAYNTFDEPDKVSPVTVTCDNFDGVITVPRGSVVSVVADICE